LEEKETSEISDEAESDIRLLIARCSLLHSQQKQREFVDCAKRVLFSFCREIVDNERFKGAIIDYRKMRNRLLALRYAIGLNFDRKMRSAGLRISQSCISTDDLWALYVIGQIRLI